MKPRPQWMTSEWLARQRAKLEKERDQLRKHIESETSQLQAVGTSNPSEPGDMAEEDREGTEVAQTLQVSQSSFHDVEEALERLRKGNYGRCARCQGWISKERLTAIPSAVRCVTCQAEFEKQGN